jgi:hypothetical protein
MMQMSLAALTLSILLHASSALAQTSPAIGHAALGCGDPKVKFDVKAGKSGGVAHTDPAKALVYLIEDDFNFPGPPTPTTRVAIDGQWVGANHGNSYFAVPISPGSHDLCTSWQNLKLTRGSRSAGRHFTAKPGGVYFFEVKNSRYPSKTSFAPDTVDVTVDHLDPNEGRILISNFKLSTSRPKS